MLLILLSLLFNQAYLLCLTLISLLLMTLGRRVSFEDDNIVVEGPTDGVESKIRQTVELKQADNLPTNTESTTSPIVELKDKAIKDTYKIRGNNARPQPRLRIKSNSATTESTDQLTENRKYATQREYTGCLRGKP